MLCATYLTVRAPFASIVNERLRRSFTWPIHCVFVYLNGRLALNVRPRAIVLQSFNTAQPELWK